MNRRSVLIFVLWLAASGAGMYSMLAYERAPGAPGNPSEYWPTESAIEPDASTLLIFAHPHCPCTRASIGELARIMAHCQGKVRAHVIFFLPAGELVDWVRTDLWRSAEAIPGVTVHADRDGAEARLFNVATSGQSALYAGGRLLFCGGITGGRGHEGDNAGEDAIVTLLAGGRTPYARTPVFGCPLNSPRP